MLHVDHGVYLLTTSPAAHHYTYTEGRSGTTRTMLTPFLAGEEIISTSGYYGYMHGVAPSPNDHVYSSLSFAVNNGTTHEITQAAEVDAQGRTIYVRYINGQRSTGAYSYGEAGELSYTVTAWNIADPESDITAIVNVMWKYRNVNGTYATTTYNMGKGGVLLRQGDRTQTDYTYSITENTV